MSPDAPGARSTISHTLLYDKRAYKVQYDKPLEITLCSDCSGLDGVRPDGAYYRQIISKLIATYGMPRSMPNSPTEQPESAGEGHATTQSGDDHFPSVNSRGYPKPRKRSNVLHVASDELEHYLDSQKAEDVCQRLSYLEFPYRSEGYPGRTKAVASALGMAESTWIRYAKPSGLQRRTVAFWGRMEEYVIRKVEALESVLRLVQAAKAEAVSRQKPHGRGMFEVRVRDESGIPRNAAGASRRNAPGYSAKEIKANGGKPLQPF